MPEAVRLCFTWITASYLVFASGEAQGLDAGAVGTFHQLLTKLLVEFPRVAGRTSQATAVLTGDALDATMDVLAVTGHLPGEVGFGAPSKPLTL